ncbi:MAG: ABC transporter substrate-binding protein [Alphaproteobacteria bacterium]
MRLVLQSLLLVVIAAGVGGYVGSAWRDHSRETTAVKASAYERVMATRTLRCGYITYPPILVKDPNSGQMSGFIYDLMLEIGQRLDVKINWAEEVGWANNVQGLLQGRYDAICAGYWRNAKEGQYLDYTVPFFYSALGAFVRADDHRFDGDINLLNDPGVTLITTDGALAEVAARHDFPRMKIRALPNLADISQLMTELVTGKADVVFIELMNAGQYNKANPGQLRQLNPDRPLRFYQNTLALPPHEPQLKAMLDSVLYEMRDSGVVEKLLLKYEPAPGTMVRVATPYAPHHAGEQK